MSLWSNLQLCFLALMLVCESISSFFWMYCVSYLSVCRSLLLHSLIGCNEPLLEFFINKVHMRFLVSDVILHNAESWPPNETVYKLNKRNKCLCIMLFSKGKYCVDEWLYFPGKGRFHTLVRTLGPGAYLRSRRSAM